MILPNTVLVDTSLWIDHLGTTKRRQPKPLSPLLEQGVVSVHPFIVGELACGNLRNRREVLRSLAELPILPVATDDEVMTFIEARSLMGRGIGYIDANLLASVVLSGPTRLWTRDRRLHTVATGLGVAYEASG